MKITIHPDNTENLLRPISSQPFGFIQFKNASNKDWSLGYVYGMGVGKQKNMLLVSNATVHWVNDEHFQFRSVTGKIEIDLNND